MDDIKLAFETLRTKAAIYNRLWDYYDGNQELVYSSERLREAFSSLNARFSLNWCGLVVDAVLERMEFKQWTVAQDEGATQRLNAWWDASGMNLDADDLELCLLVTGEAFVIAWDEGNGLEAFYNDSRLVAVFYESANPRQKRMAAKMWEADDGGARLTLYYPDRLVYLGSNKKLKDITNHRAFLPLSDVEDGAVDEAANMLGMVPVWHFRREQRAIKSELGPSVLDIQDAINKLLADMMVASEYGAFKQRYIISQADVGSLKNAPNEIWDIPAGDGLGQDTSVGEFSNTDLANFMGQIEKLSTAVASMTRTPLYYFFLGARADPSGETLYGMDGPLVKKAQKYIKRLKAEWRQFGAFMAAMIGVDAAIGDIQVEYDNPHALQPLTAAQTRKTNRDAGMPLTTQLRREGWTPQELAGLADDIDTEQQAAQTSLAVALLNQQRQFDAGGGVDA